MDEHNVIRKMTHRNPKKARLQESDRIPRFTRVRLVSAFDPIADTEMVEF